MKRNPRTEVKTLCDDDLHAIVKSHQKMANDAQRDAARLQGSADAARKELRSRRRTAAKAAAA